MRPTSSPRSRGGAGDEVVALIFALLPIHLSRLAFQKLIEMSRLLLMLSASAALSGPSSFEIHVHVYFQFEIHLHSQAVFAHSATG